MPLEQERKYLVGERRPRWPVSFEDTAIIQTYLLNDDAGVVERVRERRHIGPTVWTHTLKRHLGPGVNEEDETTVSRQRYLDLLQRHDPSLHVIEKMRRTFSWEGLTFELDTFRRPGRLLLLEVELPDMNVHVPLPSFLDIQREVTEDKRYSNAHIARHGIPT